LIFHYVLKILSPIITHVNASAAKPIFSAALSPEAKTGDYYGNIGLDEWKGKLVYA
jgi:hypothetical protein